MDTPLPDFCKDFDDPKECVNIINICNILKDNGS